MLPAVKTKQKQKTCNGRQWHALSVCLCVCGILSQLPGKTQDVISGLGQQVNSVMVFFLSLSPPSSTIAKGFVFHT